MAQVFFSLFVCFRIEIQIEIQKKIHKIFFEKVKYKGTKEIIT